MLSIGLIFMRFSDRVNQRALIAISSVIQMIGMALLAVFPLTTPIALAYLMLVWFGSGFGAQSFFQLWSAELFPTLICSTAQRVRSRSSASAWGCGVDSDRFSVRQRNHRYGMGAAQRGEIAGGDSGGAMNSGRICFGGTFIFRMRR